MLFLPLAYTLNVVHVAPRGVQIQVPYYSLADRQSAIYKYSTKPHLHRPQNKLPEFASLALLQAGV